MLNPIMRIPGFGAGVPPEQMRTNMSLNQYDTTAIQTLLPGLSCWGRGIKGAHQGSADPTRAQLRGCNVLKPRETDAGIGVAH